MKFLLTVAAATIFTAFLGGCASPTVVESKQSSDRMMSCDALKTAYNEAKDFEGKVTLVLFGFTQCPDVCPTSLAELAQVMKLLGDQASRVQVLMISVDPERDTPEVLRAYVSGFDSRFLGLTGTPGQIKDVASAFKAYYARAATVNGNYNMDHSANFYLLDTKGESRVLLANNTGAENIAHDIRALLR